MPQRRSIGESESPAASSCNERQLYRQRQQATCPSQREASVADTLGLALDASEAPMDPSSVLVHEYAKAPVEIRSPVRGSCERPVATQFCGVIDAFAIIWGTL